MAPKDPINVIISGVGGQGNILASELVSQAAFSQGFEVSVGETFGVTQRGGSVQSIIELEDGSGLKLTVARYYTPKDRSIQELGIEPDVTVRLPLFWTPPAGADPETAEDYILWTALQTLKAGNRIRSTARSERDATPDG